MAEFPGIAHVALTVTDLRASAEWYQRLVGTDPVLDEDAGGFHHIVFAMPGGTLLGLHSHPDTDSSEGFSEFRPGLDHLAFACADRAELERWGTRLDELGVSSSPIEDSHYGSGLSFRDPDNIALELFAPPA